MLYNFFGEEFVRDLKGWLENGSGLDLIFMLKFSIVDIMLFIVDGICIVLFLGIDVVLIVGCECECVGEGEYE